MGDFVFKEYSKKASFDVPALNLLYLLLSLILNYIKLNIFAFWLSSQTKQNVWRRHLAFVMALFTIFSHFINQTMNRRKTLVSCRLANYSLICICLAGLSFWHFGCPCPVSFDPLHVYWPKEKQKLWFTRLSYVNIHFQIVILTLQKLVLYNVVSTQFLAKRNWVKK